MRRRFAELKEWESLELSPCQGTFLYGLGILEPLSMMRDLCYFFLLEVVSSRKIIMLLRWEFKGRYLSGISILVRELSKSKQFLNA